MKTLRLILGDQLNQQHSWFNEVNNEVTYLMAEMRQETDYVRHHIQKVIAFFLSMRNFAKSLENQGHHCIYLKIGDANNPQNLDEIVAKYLERLEIDKFEYLLPDEYRLDEQLKSMAKKLGVPTQSFDTEHFYTSRYELREFFKGKKQLVMESFYRMMRKKHGILVLAGQPEGGKWNFDHSNRKKWKGHPEIPPMVHMNKNVDDIIAEIGNARVKTMGTVDGNNFNWPTNRTECLELLDHFCKNLLTFFGDFQDAMHTEEKFMFHSRLSFAMNSKMLSPKEVVDKTIHHYDQQRDKIHISQVEGFVRQIIGWREYMRGIYWKEMPKYGELNQLDNHNKLPKFFWTGDTKMNCLKQTIQQSLDHAYAHHIQRLMITGNYALLTQSHPDEVDQWYLGIYIDALEWVEITNTRGMSQFADGGIVGTKPYVSSGNYINKMGNYCDKCPYSPAVKIGDRACPFNALYWNFLDAKKEFFQDNPRMGMMLNLLNKKGADELRYIRERAQDIIENPEKY